MNSDQSGDLRAYDVAEPGGPAGVVAASDSQSGTLPLVVDLDGTLISGDVFAEQLVATALRGAGTVGLARHGLRGRAALKSYVARGTEFHPATLPYRADLLQWLRGQRDAGRRLVLATAADISVAQQVADHLGLFESVLASDGRTNLKGKVKREKLIKLFGEGGFVYVGDSRADLPVWEASGGAVLVAAPGSVADTVRRQVPIEAAFARPASNASLAALKLLRPRQWLKNLLVFIPLISARAFTSWPGWGNALLVFAAFSVLASAGYVFNDLLDLGSDRLHPSKRNRPLAAGHVQPMHALALAITLVPVGLLLGLLSEALGWAASYFAVSIAYSAHLKGLQLVDVFTLAGLYTLRVLAGGAATGYEVSTWLMAFSGFIFLALGAMKRVTELRARLQDGGTLNSRRAYELEDVGFLETFGVAATMTSAVVMTLYVQSQVEGGAAIRSPVLLLGVVPAILFWQARLWLATWRGYMLEDPIMYAARDWVTRVTAVVVCALFVLSAWV